MDIPVSPILPCVIQGLCRLHGTGLVRHCHTCHNSITLSPHPTVQALRLAASGTDLGREAKHALDTQHIPFWCELLQSVSPHDLPAWRRWIQTIRRDYQPAAPLWQEPEFKDAPIEESVNYLIAQVVFRLNLRLLESPEYLD